MRVVQVGMGGAGRVWAADCVPEIEDVELVGCVDRDAEALKLTQAEVGVPEERCYTSFSAALDELDPDAVLIT
ncbi:MAG: Gfo/Idh/MocA family oxidoreductase, partial [Chloroflexota bacterium]|nr:Gfo/Idh/MocA family oxidoreductase [Chloroflexota bacterium]